FVPFAFAHTRGFTVFSPGPKTGRLGLQSATALLSALQSATGVGSRLGSRCVVGLAESLEDEADADGGEGRNRTDECSFCRAVPYHLATPPSHLFSYSSALNASSVFSPAFTFHFLLHSAIHKNCALLAKFFFL